MTAPLDASRMSTTSFEKPVVSYRFLIRAKLLDAATATEGGARLAEMEGTAEMETGIGVEVDPPAFEAVPGTMVSQTSWAQSGKLLPDLLLPS